MAIKKKATKRITAPKKKKAPAKTKAAAPKKKVAAKKPAAPKKKVAAEKPAAKKLASPKKAAPKKVAAKKAPRPKPEPKRAAPAAQRHTGRESLSLETSLLASPERVYAAWIDSGEHSELTGGEATIDAREGGKHSAWSGYIEGRFITLEPGKRLVMTWRTTEFDESDPDSLVELRFLPDGGGTRVVIDHTELPLGGAHKYATGWREFYFVPMQKYFG